MRLNLPDVQVSDLAVTEKDIVIGTHGRSIYILDDVSPVRDHQFQTSKDAVHLFKPYYAVRNVQKAIFQYYLEKDSSDLKIEILDKQNKVIQTFIGEAKKAIKDSTAEEDEDDRKPPSPTIKKGYNKFEWDLKYPAATSFAGMILWGANKYNGPLAVPGMYHVRLTAAGKTSTQPFEIKLDPRIKDVTNADLIEKFDLAMQIKNEVSKANEAVIKIRGIKEKMAKTNTSENDKLFVEQLSIIEGNLYQVKNQSSQDPLNFPIKLNNKLASLQRVVESGEYKPTAGSYKVFKELKGELAKELNQLDKILKAH